MNEYSTLNLNLHKVLIPKNKEGSKIQIKKKNRGKFTDYCGGKVTDACIQQGKKSPNPTIRKRATFAANARTWKHEQGGTLLPKQALAFPKGNNELSRIWTEQMSLGGEFLKPKKPLLKPYSILDDNGKIDRKTLKLKKKKNG